MKRKLLIIGIITSSLFIGNVAIASTDVDSNHWAKSSIEEMQSRNIMSGYPDGSFKPDNYITREEVSKTIYAFAKSVNPDTTNDLPNSENSLFPDVLSDSWSSKYINWMSSERLSTGYPDGTYKPNNNISRAEFSTLMSNYLTSTGENWKNSEVIFNDTDSNWAKEYINKMAGMNYINGYSDGSFKPDNSITRAEVSSILGKIIKTNNPTPPNTDETESQKNAVKKASTLLNISPFSKAELIVSLETYGFSSSDAKYAVENINANWNDQAVKMAYSYLDSIAFSKVKLAEQLEYKKFETSEINYAINNITVDWNDQALKKATNYLEIGAFSKKGLYSQLEFEEFETSQIEYAINNIVVDWNYQAYKKTDSYLQLTAFSESKLISQLQFDGFESSEIEYVTSNMHIDWNTQALKKAEEYLKYDAFTKEEMIDQLLYEGFTEDQTNYAINLLKL